MSLFAEIKRRNVLRVMAAYLAGAWLLVQVADTVVEAYELPQSVVAVLITLLAIGLIPAAVIAWIFELTPEGLKRDADIAADKALAPRTHRRTDGVIMLVLAIGVGYFALDKFVLDPARDAAREAAAEDRGFTRSLVESYGDKSIAVLPFADLSPAGDERYFSDGIAEELLNLLARLRDLRVISRSSAFQYRGDDIHIPTVAEELNVTYVLEGSVRKAGDRLRITAQLIDARADTHLWSETYDRRLDDVFAIQDEISQAIVEELQVRVLGARPRAARTDAETHALYLQAQQLMWVRQSGDSELAESLLREALARDPDYLPALNKAVVAVFNATGDSERDKYSVEEGIRLMGNYVDRILAIDPRNAEATVHRGWMAFFYNADLETAATYINRALDYDPTDATVLFIAGSINRHIGHNNDAAAFYEAALRRDPMCSACLYNLASLQFRSGQYELAIKNFERRMRLADGGWYTLGHNYLFMGDAEKALELYGNQADDRVSWLTYSAIAYHDLGRVEDRDAALAELTQVNERRALLNLARVQAWMGNIDEAFASLDRYIDPDSPKFTHDFLPVIWNPFLRNLHDDPRWLELRAQAGLTAERLDAIEIKLPSN